MLGVWVPNMRSAFVDVASAVEVDDITASALHNTSNHMINESNYHGTIIIYRNGVVDGWSVFCGTGVVVWCSCENFYAVNCVDCFSNCVDQSAHRLMTCGARARAHKHPAATLALTPVTCMCHVQESMETCGPWCRLQGGKTCLLFPLL